VHPDASASRYRYTASGRLQQIGDAENNFGDGDRIELVFRRLAKARTMLVYANLAA
jgi:hypothetical protein